MKRPYRVIVGRAYPLTVKASNTIFDSQYDRKLHEASTTSHEDRHRFYHDKSMRLAKPDIRRFVGKPIRYEHDPNINVGEITDTWTDKKGHMWMSSRIYTDTPDGQAVMNGVDSKQFKGLSVGMNPKLSDDERFVLHMEPSEISIVSEGYYAGSDLTIAASGKTDYKNSERVFFSFQNMSGEKKAAEVQDTPPAQDNNDMTEFARQLDDVVTQKMDMEKKAAELQAKLEAYEKRDAEEKKRYEEMRLPQAEEIIKILNEQHKANTGNDDAEITPQYADFVKNSFLTRDTEPTAMSIEASARSWKKTHEENKKNLARLEDLTKKNSAAKAQIEASRAKVFNQETAPATETESEKPAIAASGGENKQLFLSLFGHAPSELERQLLTRDYPASLGALNNNQLPGIMASNGQKRVIPPAPIHPQVNEFRNSWRFVSDELFATMLTMNPNQAFAYPMKVTTERLEQ